MQLHISLIQLTAYLNNLAILELNPEVVKKLKMCSTELQETLQQLEPQH